MYGHPENPDVYDNEPSGAVAFFLVILAVVAVGFSLGYAAGAWWGF